MNASFTSVLPFSEVILHQVISTLEGTLKDDSDYCTATPTWLDSISGVISDQEAYSALAASLSKLNGRKAKEYDPINENKALVSELVTLLFLFEGLLSQVRNKSWKVALRYHSNILRRNSLAISFFI